MLRLALLGAPAIRGPGGPVALPSQKAQALLFYLAAEAGRAFTRGQLIALLWEESDERDGRNSLSTVLSRLRQALPVVPLRAEGDSLAWDEGAGVAVDLHEFQALTRSRAGGAPAAAQLEAAGALYGGPLLDGFGLRDGLAYDEWLRVERERWQYRALNLLDQLVTLHSGEGRYGPALEHARRAVTIDPLQERFHRALMRLFALAGDRAAALAQFRACAELLERELGVEPDPETAALAAQIRAGPLPAPEPAAAPAAVTSPAQAAAPSRLAARLERARRESFVGRQAELALFGAALAEGEPPFTVLHLYGPGGVGKTTLLAAMARQAGEAGVPVFSLDGRALEPTPDAVTAALREQLGAELAALPERMVLLVDTYERLMPVESWLRDTLLGQLPAGALVVLAGRMAPSASWRADPGWQAISRSVGLNNLSGGEAADYLRRRGVPPEQHGAVVRVTHGFPLGLSLAAEVISQRPDEPFAGLEAPDLVQNLLERFVDSVPSIAHRATLEAASQVRIVDEPLLAAMLARDEARELFDWLRGLSFVSRGRRGIFLHDMAREAMAADLRWRNPPWCRELHDRARAFYLERFEGGAPTAQQQALLDLIFLHDNPIFHALFSWQAIEGLREDTARPDDTPRLLGFVRRHEGEQSARIAAGWFARQPGGVSVVRGDDGAPVGFNLMLALGPDEPAEGDPCVEAIRRFLEREKPLAPGQIIAIDRLWMDGEHYQGVSPAQGLIFVAATRYLLNSPQVAYSFHVFAEPESWAPALEQVRFRRLPEADFGLDGRRYGVFCHDWRAEPARAWLAALAEQELRGEL